jgi:acetyl-CoA carboxylase biotin carboxylase subunit
MIGKIITHGKTREEAIIRMERALSETIIEGIETVIPLQLRLLACPEFRQSAVHTKFVEELLDQDE